MLTPFLVAALAIALLGAVSVLWFESPIRAAGGLVTCCVGIAAACGALGVPVVPGYVLWVGAGGIGLLLLGAVLVLVASAEERGPRFYNVRATLGLVAALALWAVLSRAVPSNLAPTETGRAAVDAAAIGTALATELAPTLAIALAALAASMLVAVGLIRRRA